MILNLWSVPVYKENTDHTWSRFSEEQKNKLLELQKEKLGVVVSSKDVPRENLEKFFNSAE